MDKEQYIVVRINWPHTQARLQEVVNKKIEEGYVPIGGLAVWNDKITGRCMAQAMHLTNMGE